MCGASRTDATRNYGVYKYMAWLRALGALYGAVSGDRSASGPGDVRATERDGRRMNSSEGCRVPRSRPASAVPRPVPWAATGAPHRDLVLFLVNVVYLSIFRAYKFSNRTPSAPRPSALRLFRVAVHGSGLRGRGAAPASARAYISHMPSFGIRRLRRREQRLRYRNFFVCKIIDMTYPHHHARTAQLAHLVKCHHANRHTTLLLCAAEQRRGSFRHERTNARRPRAHSPQKLDTSPLGDSPNSRALPHAPPATHASSPLSMFRLHSPLGAGAKPAALAPTDHARHAIPTPHHLIAAHTRHAHATRPHPTATSYHPPEEPPPVQLLHRRSPPPPPLPHVRTAARRRGTQCAFPPLDTLDEARRAGLHHRLHLVERPAVDEARDRRAVEQRVDALPALARRARGGRRT